MLWCSDNVMCVSYFDWHHFQASACFKLTHTRRCNFSLGGFRDPNCTVECIIDLTAIHTLYVYLFRCWGRTGGQWMALHEHKSRIPLISFIHFMVITHVMKGTNAGWTERSLITLESGNVSLKNVGSHDKRVKKVLAEQRCVIITAL